MKCYFDKDSRHMTLTPIKRFVSLLANYKIELRLIYFYALCIGIVNLTLPLGIQAIINFLQAGEVTSTWMVLVGFVLAGIAITGLLQVLQLRVVENIQQDLFARSSFEFAYRIPKITLVQLDRAHAPELVNRFFDTLTIQKGLPKILMDFSLSTFQIIFGLIVLAIYSPYFILLGFTFVLILWLIYRFTGPKGLTTSLKESKYKYQLAYWLDEIARANRTFKIFSKNNFHLHKADGIVQDYLGSRETHFRVLLSQFRLFIIFKVVVAAGLLLLGGHLVFQQQMNIGQFVAAEIIIILIINSVEKIMKIIDNIYDVLTALDKIGFVTDLPLDQDSGVLSADFDNGVALKVKDISFGFPKEKRDIISNLSFELQPRDKVVLKGASGSGKSLLLQILAGMYEVNEGEISINGVPFFNYQRDQIDDTFGISLPVNQLFDGTIRENILLGREVESSRLRSVIQLLNLEEFVIHQAKGIDSIIDSGGKKLPRSIIQKLLIARIIINEPALLLLEDPLQFIADEEKIRIIDYLMHEDRKWTLIVISDFYYWEKKSNRTIELIKN